MPTNLLKIIPGKAFVQGNESHFLIKKEKGKKKPINSVNVMPRNFIFSSTFSQTP